MSLLVAGQNYTFNFGTMSFANGITINSITTIDENGDNKNLLAGVSPSPIIHSEEDLLELFCYLQISSSFALTDVGTFTGNSDLVFQDPALNVTDSNSNTWIIDYAGGLPTVPGDPIVYSGGPLGVDNIGMYNTIISVGENKHSSDSVQYVETTISSLSVTDTITAGGGDLNVQLDEKQAQPITLVVNGISIGFSILENGTVATNTWAISLDDDIATCTKTFAAGTLVPGITVQYIN